MKARYKFNSNILHESIFPRLVWWQQRIQIGWLTESIAQHKARAIAQIVFDIFQKCELCVESFSEVASLEMKLVGFRRNHGRHNGNVLIVMFVNA